MALRISAQFSKLKKSNHKPKNICHGLKKKIILTTSQLFQRLGEEIFILSTRQEIKIYWRNQRQEDEKKKKIMIDASEGKVLGG